MRGNHEYVQHTKNFFSNIFNTRLLDPVGAGPTNTEGWLHLLHHEAAESIVMRTWSWKGAYRQTNKVRNTKPWISTKPTPADEVSTIPRCKEPSAINTKTMIPPNISWLFLNVLQILIYHNLHSHDHNLPQKSQPNLEFQSDII